MKNLIEFLVNHLVTVPAEAQVTQTVAEDGVTNIYTIAVAEADLGRVIGYRGQTIKAIRSLAKIAAVFNQEKFRVELAE